MRHRLVCSLAVVVFCLLTSAESAPAAPGGGLTLSTSSGVSGTQITITPGIGDGKDCTLWWGDSSAEQLRCSVGKPFDYRVEGVPGLYRLTLTVSTPDATPDATPDTTLVTSSSPIIGLRPPHFVAATDQTETADFTILSDVRSPVTASATVESSRPSSPTVVAKPARTPPVAALPTGEPLALVGGLGALLVLALFGGWLLGRHGRGRRPKHLDGRSPTAGPHPTVTTRLGGIEVRLGRSGPKPGPDVQLALHRSTTITLERPPK